MFRKKKEDEEYSIYEADDCSSYEYGSNSQGSSYGSDESYDEEPEGKVRLSIASKAIIVCALYFIFVMLGVFSTSFTVNEFGVKEAQVITIANREDRKDYNSLKGSYAVLAAFVRGVEECDDKRDRVLANNFELATEYQTLSAFIDKDLLKIKKIEVNNKYGSVLNQTVTVYERGRLYLDGISNTLMADGDPNSAELLVLRANFYLEYEMLTANMSQFADSLKIDDGKFYSEASLTTEYYVPQTEDEDIEEPAVVSDEAINVSGAALTTDPALMVGSPGAITGATSEGGLGYGERK